MGKSKQKTCPLTQEPKRGFFQKEWQKKSGHVRMILLLVMFMVALCFSTGESIANDTRLDANLIKKMAKEYQLYQQAIKTISGKITYQYDEISSSNEKTNSRKKSYAFYKDNELVRLEYHSPEHEEITKILIRSKEYNYDYSFDPNSNVPAQVKRSKITNPIRSDLYYYSDFYTPFNNFYRQEDGAYFRSQAIIEKVEYKQYEDLPDALWIYCTESNSGSVFNANCIFILNPQENYSLRSLEISIEGKSVNLSTKQHITIVSQKTNTGVLFPKDVRIEQTCNGVSSVERYQISIDPPRSIDPVLFTEAGFKELNRNYTIEDVPDLVQTNPSSFSFQYQENKLTGFPDLPWRKIIAFVIVFFLILLTIRFHFKKVHKEEG